ncbi:serine hydrolase domain-containing protein [Flagellimonas ochracea]|uniref:serine hydrolase domain-containing protein n=1 Tax=Flagellimonas ochracea TaxID=2696472 RepID=UPI0028BEEE19|nr:serine hydrolase domain-containing protein [Allomuricauda ochracea]
MSAFLTFFKRLFSTEKETPKLLDGLQGIVLTDAIFHNLVAEGKVPGMSVTIMRNNEMLLQKGYGYADLEQGIPVHPTKTVFRIASISKCITGLALGKMIEEQIVDLDASFYNYVPYYPKKKYSFTLRQLAGHTAGVRSYRGKEYALNKPYSIKDSIEVFQGDPLVFEPGKGYLYNSFDFVLLSLGMQEAAGIPFENYVKEKVLKPLGMKNTFVPPMDNNSNGVKNLAQCYTKITTGFKKAIPVNNFYKVAGGGFLSSSENIARMGQAILQGKLLKKETYNLLLTSQTVNGKPTYYGLGFQVSEDAKGRKFMGHVGNSVGAYTNFFIYPKEQLVVVVLINSTDPKVQEELDRAIDALLDLPSS